VQLLEQRFNVRLFDRDRSGVRVTAEGQVMLDAAAALLANAEDLERQWDCTAKGQSGLVRFGVAPMPPRAFLSEALLERLSTAPEVRNDVIVRNVDALLPLLVAGEIEFFIAAEGQIPETIPVRAEGVGRCPRGLIVRPSHPLLSEDAREGSYPVLISGGMGSARLADMREPGDGPHHIVEDFGTLVRLTAATDAIWHCSAFAVAEEIELGLLCELPESIYMDPPDFRIMAYSLERRSLSAPAKALLHIFRRQIGILLPRHRPASPLQIRLP
jgi:DNA-binding transcriptional LysR family regulator